MTQQEVIGLIHSHQQHLPWVTVDLRRAWKEASEMGVSWEEFCSAIEHIQTHFPRQAHGLTRSVQILGNEQARITLESIPECHMMA